MVDSDIETMIYQNMETEKDSDKKTVVYDGLCLSGGGSKGVGLLGALHMLENKGFFCKCKKYGGTSIGAIILLMMACGMDAWTVFGHIYWIENIVDLDSIKIENFTKDFGCLNMYESFGYKIRDAILKSTSWDHVPTLQELFDSSGWDLYISVLKLIPFPEEIPADSNEERFELAYINHRKYPDLDAVKACCMTASIPGIFTRVKYENRYYLDGGPVDNLPFSPLVDSGCKNVLTLRLLDNTKKASKDDFATYFYNIFLMSMREVTSTKLRIYGDKLHYVLLEMNGIGSVDFTMSREKKMDAFCQGRDIMKKLLDENTIKINE